MKVNQIHASNARQPLESDLSEYTKPVPGFPEDGQFIFMDDEEHPLATDCPPWCYIAGTKHVHTADDHPSHRSEIVRLPLLLYPMAEAAPGRQKSTVANVRVDHTFREKDPCIALGLPGLDYPVKLRTMEARALARLLVKMADIAILTESEHEGSADSAPPTQEPAESRTED